jgi:hypothetical protein
MRLRLGVLVLGLAVFAVTAHAQNYGYGTYYKWEITPFIGYEAGGSYPVQGSSAVDRARANDSMSYGVFVDRSFWEDFQFEFMYNRNDTKIAEHDVILNQYLNAYNTDINQFQFGISYMFRGSDKKLRPYVGGGLGFTHFGNSGTNSNFTAFSYGIGGGVKYYLTHHFGVRGDARFVPTYENSAPEEFCDQFGDCFEANHRNFLNRGNFTAGLIVRF